MAAVREVVQVLDPQLATAVFALGALVVGVVVFGGTTLAYFVGERRSESPGAVHDRPSERSAVGVTRGEGECRRDEAA